MLKHTDFDGAIFRWLNDYAPQGILITDTDLVIRGWNLWLEQHTGRSAAAALGKPLLEVFPELAQRRLDDLYREALHGQVTVLAQRFHQYLVRLDARPEYGLPAMQQSARIAPLMERGEVIGTITAIEDVSERVVRENDLTAAREAADRANQAKDRFLAVLSHDLRTPLTAILGWAQIFRARPGDEQIVKRGADVIERNAAIQLQLIEQILDISRFTASKLELNVESGVVREMVVTALETLEPVAEAKGIRIEQNLPEDPRIASLDPKRFQQIIWNLISNALKFTPKGGWVRVTLTHAEKAFQLAVADNGKGIDAENLPHLFEPLWQAEDSEGHGGLGLGLAIVRSLVQLHGGTVRAESAGPGQGAQFIVEIPWRPASGQASPKSLHSSRKI